MGSKSAGLAERCIRGKARISPADVGFLLTTLGRSADTGWSLRLAESQRKGSRASSRLSSPTSNSFLPSPSRKRDTALLLFPAVRRQAADSRRSLVPYVTIQQASDVFAGTKTDKHSGVLLHLVAVIIAVLDHMATTIRPPTHQYVVRHRNIQRRPKAPLTHAQGPYEYNS
jgi:hypothetical protein